MSELLKLVSDTEQDEAACREWWDSSTLAAKMAVWDRIQTGYDDPALEVMSRFAQLAFSRAAINFDRPPGP